ncbi:complement C2 [Gymnodraco acuticeps]|uniref:C3/C5 convertase n=1 Tax=Gymnodraco acuticeps TaxID=8218 RepID=A0A6P8WNK8_GYMAC|nr:complement C2 [Gymnodraco acuticeps]
MYVKPILWILLFSSVQEVSLQEYNYDDETYEDLQPLSCSTTENIKGGNVTYSQGGMEGSVLTYHCGPDQYPFPVSSRLCGDDKEWSVMRSNNGRQISRAICKDILCPAQLQLDHGDFWPRDQWARVGTTQTFSCQEGFTLYGSAQRNCTMSGEWTGTTPICDNHADDCSNPGIPPGASRSEGRFQTGEKVIYRCQAGLDLLGSAERECLENREWSGSTPRCQGAHMFDSPSVVAAAMAGSFAGVMDVISPDSKKTESSASFARTVLVSEGSRINFYILLDTSGSITKQDFDLSRNATIALIRKLDSYEVQLRFHVLSFATMVKDIVDITYSDISGNIDDIIWILEGFNYTSHGRKTGTNLYAALYRVSEKINFLKQNSANNHFNETQNIIIIETDGYSNTGKKPEIALAQIRNLLGYRDQTSDNTDETKLDVYVFGIGSKVKKDQLNSLASKKRGEQHLFVVRDYQILGEVFNSIISDKSVTMCGIAQEWEEYTKTFTRPWHVTVETINKITPACVGSIVSQNWVLTAAHCFARASTEDPPKVHIDYGEGRVVSERVIMHPKYNIRALKHRNVSEFYDYDVALVQVTKSIPLSWKARPICLPCTVAASRAMKRVNSTCQEHRKALLPHEETAAFFINKNDKIKQTHIQMESHRPSCVEKARQTLKDPTNVTLDEYIPDRFLCTGGSTAYKDPITCKGDSGGSLYLQKRKRYFQVGVVSWGTTNVCDTGLRWTSDNPPPDARDFHIDLFKIMPWLKQHLGQEIQFLPEVEHQ